MWLTLWRIFLRMCNVQYLLNNFDSWQLGVYSQSPRELNRKIFPILTASQISEDFYEDFLEDDLGFAILAYYGDMLVSMYRRMTWGSPFSHTTGICWSVCIGGWPGVRHPRILWGYAGQSMHCYTIGRKFRPYSFIWQNFTSQTALQ